MPETNGGGPTRTKEADGYLLGSYRIATAPEPNSSRLTSFKSRRFYSPVNTSARGPPAWAEPQTRTHRSIPTPPTPAAASRLPRTVPYPIPASTAELRSSSSRGDLGKAVQQLKRESGKGLLVGGVKLPLALAELGLIDEDEFVVQPRLVGHGPTLFAGLSKRIDLKLVSRLEFGSGAVAMRYEPRR